MALPTAQLGSLGTMSMPYSIPVYEKGPGVLEKALASFLVNAAGGVAQRGAENVMSRDYAKEFGEDPAKGFGRLLGPKVGERDAATRRQQAFTAGEGQKERDFRGSQETLSSMEKAGLEQSKQANDLEMQKRAIDATSDIEGTRAMNSLMQEVQQGQNRMDVEKLQGQQRQDAIREEYRARGQLPSEQINTSILQRLQSQLQGKGDPGGQASAVNPNIAKFAQGGGAQPAGPVAPAGPQGDFVSNEDDVAKLLAAGRTPQEIIAILARQNATNTAAQAKPLPDLTQSQPQSQQVPPELLAVLRDFGLLQGGSSPVLEMPVTNARQLR